MRICTRVISLLFLIVISFSSLSAQSSPDKDQKPKKVSKLGFGMNLGNLQFYNNSFIFGLAPNVAYKLSESLAVGAMVKLTYFYEKFPDYGNQKFSAFDVGPTIFTRWKPLWSTDGATPFLQGLFLQAEYERASIARPFINNFGEIFTVREGENYLYLGLGASSGYPFSSFFSIHFNILDDANSSRIPFDYRVGFTYNY